MQTLESLVTEGLSTREIAHRLGSNQSTVRRWLKQAHLSTKPATLRRERKSPTECTLCGRSSKQYDGHKRSLCGSCTTRVRRFRQKSAAVVLLGGHCQECKWEGPIAGYAFHHTRDKKFEIGVAAHKSWAVLKAELAKCVLLCTRCHTLKHSADQDEKFLGIVRAYQGSLLS